tara:strand:+ start:115 stop:495 length:381 start_codon:yes stop_codon:yes gene_type:complete
MKRRKKVMRWAKTMLSSKEVESVRKSREARQVRHQQEILASKREGKMIPSDIIEGMEHYYRDEIKSLRKSIDKMFDENRPAAIQEGNPYCGGLDLFMKVYAPQVNKIVERIASVDQCLKVLESLKK